tara:strand:+ start:2548 stop:2772 length:225 start_codon:yes stop_codon:yes gene_type:complete
MADTQTILAMILSISAGLMIWYILRLRQNGRINILEDLEDYSGMARDPEKLMEPDDEALDELDRIISKEFDSQE